MNKRKALAIAGLILMALGAVSAFAEDIQGLWKIIDDKTGNPRAYVFLYMNGGKLYGRMLATISKDTGLVDDTILTQKFKADALAGNPPNCGLDFVYEMQLKGKEWKGSIIDPEDGKVYDCTIKRNDAKLTVRGSLKGTGGLLGRNQTWLLATPVEIAAGFALPNPAGISPVIPRKK